MASPRTSSSASTAARVAGFVAKFDPAIGRVIRESRRTLRQRFPTATELVYDNYNFLVFGFSASERATDCIVSLAAGANGVGLCFPYCGTKLPDPHKMLLGSGTLNRFIRLKGAATLAEPAVVALIEAAVRVGKTPLPPGGRGTTIVRSVSVKQRPRRKGGRA